MEKHGIDRNNLNENINPKDNFYEYSTGGWRERHPLKGEYSSFGVFNLLAEKARDNVKELIANVGETPEAKIKGSIEQKIADLYALGMDMERRDKEGYSPLIPIIDRIESFTREKLADTISWLAFGLDNTFFGFGVGPDPGDSSRNILHVSEAGLGLGDRDYYLEKNETNDRILTAYHKYIADLMHLAGYSHADSERIANTVLEIETEYAKHKKTREESRNPLLSYNMMAMTELETKYPNIPWRKIFLNCGLPEIESLNVGSPKFLDFINEYLPQLTERQIKDLMLYGSVSSSMGALGEAFYDVEFEMFGKVMSGTEEKKPLWKRAQGMVGSLFGEAIGQLYVKKHFPEENKEYMLVLVENLRKALGDHIRQLTWMSESTKTKALDKLGAMKVKIGYPDKWKDYSEIVIDPSNSYMENLLKASEWFVKDNFSKLSEPVDKEKWHMYPQTVNAYYSPSMNEICFPAGILQPPFFDINAKDALNYGAIGVVIGHEMTHGFDDSGRKFDKEGNLNNWWTEEDEKAFNKLTEQLVKQFDEIEVAPGVHANGTFTLGENIADQGGLRIALTALQKTLPEIILTDDSEEAVAILKDFYLSYGGIWATNIRPEDVLLRTQSDPHSLAENRVNVTLKNITPFINAFGIEKGNGMFRPENERVVIW